MDLSVVVRSYIDRMLKEVSGMKVLLLDDETTRIVSTVYSQSEILEQEVFLVQRLGTDKLDQLFHLKVSGISRCCTALALSNIGPSCNDSLALSVHFPFLAGRLLSEANKRECQSRKS